MFLFSRGGIFMQSHIGGGTFSDPENVRAETAHAAECMSFLTSGQRSPGFKFANSVQGAAVILREVQFLLGLRTDTPGGHISQWISELSQTPGGDAVKPAIQLLKGIVDPRN